MFELRDYQESAAQDSFAAMRRGASPLVVLPTGAGKSLVIARLAELCYEHGGRTLVLQHRKELIEQNASKIESVIPQASVGRYSAGLRKKEADTDIVVAGIQSVYRRPGDLGYVKLVIIDEAHRVSDDPESQYGQLLLGLREFGSDYRAVGLSATPYRLGSGDIAGPKGYFDEIAYETKISPLIERGYLSKIISPQTENAAATKGLRVRKGDFVERDMQDMFLEHGLITRQVAEFVEMTRDRKSVIVFCSGVEHCYEIESRLEKRGLESGVIVGETPPLERESLLRRFKSGSLRFLINCNVLTEGFDHPGIDAVVMMRATLSPGLFYQAAGRGLRVCEGKEDCMLLDYGENVDRHGHLDDDDFGAKVSEPSEPAENSTPGGGARLCPYCSAEVALKQIICHHCGREIPPGLKKGEAYEGTIVVREHSVQRHKVNRVNYDSHEAKSGNMCLKVKYELEGVISPLYEYVAIEADNPHYARVWWRRHSAAPFPMTVDEAMDDIFSNFTRKPKEIKVERGREKWPRVVDYYFDCPLPTYLHEQEMPF